MSVRLLLINPSFGESFWSFRWALERILPGKRALNPPLGLATLAALCPPDWQLLGALELGWASLACVTANGVPTCTAAAPIATSVRTCSSELTPVPPLDECARLERPPHRVGRCLAARRP
jgi:hypothetical protein